MDRARLLMVVEIKFNSSTQHNNIKTIYLPHFQQQAVTPKPAIPSNQKQHSLQNQKASSGPKISRNQMNPSIKTKPSKTATTATNHQRQSHLQTFRDENENKGRESYLNKPISQLTTLAKSNRNPTHRLLPT